MGDRPGAGCLHAKEAGSICSVHGKLITVLESYRLMDRGVTLTDGEGLPDCYSM